MRVFPMVKAAIFHRPMEMPKASRGSLVEPDRVERQAHPRALHSPHQPHRPQRQRDRCEAVKRVARKVDAQELPVVVEAEAEDAESSELESLRSAECLVHLEKRPEEEPEGDGDQRCVVAPRPEQRQQQQRANGRRRGAAGEQHQQVGKGPPPEHRRRVAAHAEEGRAGEVRDAGIGELDVEPETGHQDEQRAGHEKQHEGVVMEDADQHQRRSSQSDENRRRSPPRPASGARGFEAQPPLPPPRPPPPVPPSAPTR